MRDFSNIKRIIVKIGSSSIVNNDLSINKNLINSLMSSIKLLNENNILACIVTSGAIALGMNVLGLEKKPKNMALKQACAAIGQAKLMQEYNLEAEKFNLKCGQILLNHDDFEIRKRMLYLSNTLDEMFKNKVIPIINENDALAVEEIKVGDNDTLASLISPMIHADLLILFSDIDGLYDKNPKIYKDAKMINDVYDITPEIMAMATENTSLVGTGGMVTKLRAAKICNSCKCDMIICNSSLIYKINDIVKGLEVGTLFHKNEIGISSREHWMIYKTNSCGSIVIDDGCAKALGIKKISILAKGIVDVNGEFSKGNVIDVLNISGSVLAKGIVNFSSKEINDLIGLSNDDIKKLLNKKPEIIHADNLVKIGCDYDARWWLN